MSEQNKALSQISQLADLTGELRKLGIPGADL